ncbi:MAG: sulfite exporter TauE/SafE family protein [Acidimicrobiales bacterium]
MHAGVLRDLLTLVVGVITGVMSAAFGVGGATISTPGIRLLGASAFIAVGTTLPSILPSAVTGTLRYRREGLVDWRVVAWAAPAGAAASVLGSLASHAVPGNGHWLMVLTAALLGVTAANMARAPRQETASADPAIGEAIRTSIRPREPALGLAGVGIVAGVLSGLLGVGGGIVMVPGFTELVRMPIKAAIATSLVCVAIFAIPGTVTHALLGDIDWRFALLLAVAVIPGARLGAAAALRATDRRLRIAVAVFLGLVAVVYAAGEIIALS